MIRRQYIKSSITLCGVSNGRSYQRTFYITKRLNSGGSSAVCYEAYHEGSGRGVLKEFYPHNTFGLKRTQQGQLVHSLSPDLESQRERFLRDKQEYIKPYVMLTGIKQQLEGSNLGSFIPPFELYSGCGSDGETLESYGTVYIWEPTPQVETFEKICTDIHRHPNVKPEHKLVTVLYAIKSLTDCVRILHKNALLHRDIKPGNFGFVKREDETLTQSISLFDIDSLCSVYGKNGGEIGTTGFMDPESKPGIPDTHQSDIYSIGATLFYALICTDETKENGYLYQPEYYSRLTELVNSSELIQASDSNSHPRLRNILSIILRKCLCRRAERYENCEELLSDIEKALYYVIPSDMEQNRHDGASWVLKDFEKSLDKDVNKNAALAIQYHLYENPLYQFADENEATINILVFGFANYGQKFLDACLQAGQIRGKQLNIVVVAEDLIDKEIYLSERPALSDFFNIDGSLSNIEADESYGNISFRFIGDLKNLNEKKQVLTEIITSDPKLYPHYVFVSLGNDSLNADFARCCRSIGKSYGKMYNVSYIIKESNNLKSRDLSHPVFLNPEMYKADLFSEMERMAFNVHLVWEGMVLDELDGPEKTLFKKTYNHDSCVSSVLSIKYKLYSMGINLDEIGLEEAAREYKRIIDDKTRAELVWIEHRRWVTEKLCLGWQNYDRLEKCLTKGTKNQKLRRHICIIRSRPEIKFSDSEFSYEKWDTMSAQQLEELDDLDKMSVKLHRLLKDKAEKIKTSDISINEYINNIRGALNDDPASIIAFQNWEVCIKSIWAGDESKVHQYELNRDYLLNQVKQLPEDKKEQTLEQIKVFDAFFNPVLESMEYKDYKSIDMSIIDRIPFVLTYSDNTILTIPFSIGNTSQLFQNVAAATIIKPARIIYLCLLKNESVESFSVAILKCLKYLKNKGIHSPIDLVVSLPDLTDEVDRLRREIFHLRENGIRNTKVIPYFMEEELPFKIESYLKRRLIGQKLFFIEKNNSEVSKLLCEAGLYQTYPYYSFDSKKRRFVDSCDSEILNNIDFTESLTVSDIVSLNGLSMYRAKQPEAYHDIMEIWEVYQKDPACWRVMSKALKEHSETQSVIATFQYKDIEEMKHRYRYIIPSLCVKGTKKVLAALINLQLIDGECSIINYTSDSSEVIIKDYYGNRCFFDQLFAHSKELAIPEIIYIENDTNNYTLKVLYDRLDVNHVGIPSDSAQSIKRLLNSIQEMGYIINLNEEDGMISFSYSTNRIKGLLISEEMLIEAYIVHKIKEKRSFDDVENRVKVTDDCFVEKLNADSVIAMTKGFRSIIVKCFNINCCNLEFIEYQLKRIAEDSVNAISIIIVDMGINDVEGNTLKALMKPWENDRAMKIQIIAPEKVGSIDCIVEQLMRES